MASDRTKRICVTVDPGICGFPCIIGVRQTGAREVYVEIAGTDCEQIQKLAKSLGPLSLKELFAPLSRNPVYIAAENASCHLSCAIPVAVIKAAEVAMELALPKEVHIRFMPEAACEDVLKDKTDAK